MQVLTLTLDRVFDVQRYDSARYSPRTTHFSFAAGGRNYFGLRAPGWPRIQAGDSLTVVLRRADNWQTLAGWKNLSTGERVVPAIGRVRDMLPVLCGAAFLFFVMGGSTTPGGREVAFGLRVVLALTVLAVLVQVWRDYQFRKLIESL